MNKKQLVELISSLIEQIRTGAKAYTEYMKTTYQAYWESELDWYQLNVLPLECDARTPELKKYFEVLYYSESKLGRMRKCELESIVENLEIVLADIARKLEIKKWEISRHIEAMEKKIQIKETIRTLSSGTVATLIKEVDPDVDSVNYDMIEAVVDVWVSYIEDCHLVLESWQKSWNALLDYREESVKKAITSNKKESQTFDIMIEKGDALVSGEYVDTLISYHDPSNNSGYDLIRVKANHHSEIIKMIGNKLFRLEDDGEGLWNTWSEIETEPKNKKVAVDPKELLIEAYELMENEFNYSYDILNEKIYQVLCSTDAEQYANLATADKFDFLYSGILDLEK